MAETYVRPFLDGHLFATVSVLIYVQQFFMLYLGWVDNSIVQGVLGWESRCPRVRLHLGLGVISFDWDLEDRTAADVHPSVGLYFTMSMYTGWHLTCGKAFKRNHN